jgi:hypothetical protein
MSEPQVWKVAVTPAQRLTLLNLSHGEGQKLKGQQGRVFRRFCRAFGVDILVETMTEHEKLNFAKISKARAPALHEITAENRDYALGLLEVEHHPSAETVIGPLFDVLEDIKAKPAEYVPPEGVPDYDPATEDWTPKKDDPVEVKIVAYLKAHGEKRAAELVERGAWDTPANGALTGAAKDEIAAES